MSEKFVKLFNRWRGMQCCNTFRNFVLCFVFVGALSGCGEKSLSPLDRDDVHFAGFYSDYLLESGVVAGDEGARLSRLDSATINELLARHALDRESLNRKITVYRKNPELWRSILVQVRANIFKKTGAGQ